MEKTRSSPLSFLFPWLSPLVIIFAWGENGIAVQLYKNNRLRANWHPSQLRHVLPLQLTKWMEDHHFHLAPQPYPLIKQLWQYLAPLASKKLVIDASVLATLEEISQPQDFAMVWGINRATVCLEGHYEGADRYLGMGWFQKGTQIWSLKSIPPNAIDEQLKSLVAPIQRADFLLNSIIPSLQPYLPSRADFRLITDFAVRVTVPDAHSGRLTLTLESNYPQLLPSLSVPQQKIDVLLANQAILRFPHQALTPALIQLLQHGPSITIQGVSVPLFIREQLPVMRHFYQISDDMAVKITQANPIVSIAALEPTLTLTHKRENGIGRYTTTATYHYHQHALDMNALLTAHQQNQRFVQQHGTWFEWPYNSRDLFNTLLHQRAPQVLRPEEVMGFDTRRVTLLRDRPAASAVRPGGTTPAERAQSLFKQLQYHGIPGGIVGEPKGILTMFVNACENLLRDNRQARILWLAPSNKKGSVTRAVNGSTINSYVTVASLVTLRDEPALLSHPWTLVIFHQLDQLLDGSFQSRMLPRLAWQWAFTSVTSIGVLHPFIMQVLHLPEQYYEQFRIRFLFDLEKSYSNEASNQRKSSLNTAQPAAPIPAKKEEQLPQGIVLPPASSRPISSVSSSTRRSIELNQKKIAELHEDSEQLQVRLTVEDEEQSPFLSISAPLDPPVQSNPRVKRMPEQPLAAQSVEVVEQIHKEPATSPRADSLSSVNIQTSEKERPKEAAAPASLSEKKAEQITLSSYASPVEQRVAVMKQYWHAFDEIHARQQTGMKPLWGLVEDSFRFDFEHRFRASEPYQYQLYLQLLPPTMLTEIEQLWGTTMLPRWPELIISEPFPHKLFAGAFGRALKFWHGCALTAWFICEGPSSRTDLAGLAEYYGKDVRALKEMGTPINERLFGELARAETQLGQPQPFTRQIATSQGNFGITITAATSFGTRRKGFEKLRDIISFHRRQWAERYLDLYLQKRWETEIHEAAYSYKIYIDEKGIPPAAKQFAKDAKEAINHWFGGNISELYKAIQEQSPLQPERVTILPADRTAFAFAVFKKLSAPEDHLSEQKSPNVSQYNSQTEKLTKSQYYQLNRLAAFSFWYV